MDVPHFESFPGPGNEFIQCEFSHRYFLIFHPGEFGVDPKFCRFDEIVIHIFKAHPVSDISHIILHLHHAAKPESSIGYFIENCWTRRKHPVLNPEMRHAIFTDTITWTVPSIDCAVM